MYNVHKVGMSFKCDEINVISKVDKLLDKYLELKQDIITLNICKALHVL